MCDTYSSLETLEVGGEDGVRHPRFPTNPLHHFHLVCHLDKGDRISPGEQATTIPSHCSFCTALRWVCQHFPYEWLWENKLTCGTHFGDTKLVASMTGSPVADSMSIK